MCDFAVSHRIRFRMRREFHRYPRMAHVAGKPTSDTSGTYWRGWLDSVPTGQLVNHRVCTWRFLSVKDKTTLDTPMSARPHFGLEIKTKLTALRDGAMRRQAGPTISSKPPPPMRDSPRPRANS